MYGCEQNAPKLKRAKKGFFLLDEVLKWRPRVGQYNKKNKFRGFCFTGGASVTPSNNGSEGNCRIKSNFCLTASILGQKRSDPV